MGDEDRRQVIDTREPAPNVRQGYKFTAEELQAVRECNRESFWNRSLPLSGVLSFMMYQAVKTGRVSGSPRFGPIPKVMSAAFVGYFVGKLSYQPTCVEKIMKLPNSPLADMLRKRKEGKGGGGGFQDALIMDPGFYTAASVGSRPAGPADQQINMDVMDTRPISNFDTQSSSFVGFDKAQPGENELLDEDELPPKSAQQFTTSYDDLRRQNRINYEKQKYPYNPPPPQPQQDPRRSPQMAPQNTPYREAAPPKTKNIYGDVWDDVPTQN